MFVGQDVILSNAWLVLVLGSVLVLTVNCAQWA